MCAVFFFLDWTTEAFFKGSNTFSWLIFVCKYISSAWNACHWIFGAAHLPNCLVLYSSLVWHTEIERSRQSSIQISEEWSHIWLYEIEMVSNESFVECLLPFGMETNCQAYYKRTRSKPIKKDCLASDTDFGARETIQKYHPVNQEAASTLLQGGSSNFFSDSLNQTIKKRNCRNQANKKRI